MKKTLLALSIAIVMVAVMVMAICLSANRADAENWIFWHVTPYSVDGNGRTAKNPEMLGAFDSYASCKAEENTKCGSLGEFRCKKVSGGICDTTIKVFEWLHYGKPVSENYYDCWKCYPQGMSPSQ